MPNWVKNEITFNTRGDLERAFKKLGQDTVEEDRFDFGWIIPPPKTKEECEKYFPECLNDENKHIEPDQDKPWFDWYTFQNQHWGTKWNACDAFINGSSIYFDTAWSPPEPAIDALAELMKEEKIEFNYKYAEEQGALYCGEYYFDGEEGSWNTFEEESDEAYEAYNDLWGDTFIKIDDELHNGKFAGWYDYNNDELFLADNGEYLYFDMENDFNFDNINILQELHKRCGKTFDDVIVEGAAEIDEEKYTDLLKAAIGFFKPIWADPTADPSAYEVDKEYNYVTNFNDGTYMESFSA